MGVSSIVYSVTNWLGGINNTYILFILSYSVNFGSIRWNFCRKKNVFEKVLESQKIRLWILGGGSWATFGYLTHFRRY